MTDLSATASDSGVFPVPWPENTPESLSGPATLPPGVRSEDQLTCSVTDLDVAPPIVFVAATITRYT